MTHDAPRTDVTATTPDSTAWPQPPRGATRRSPGSLLALGLALAGGTLHLPQTGAQELRPAGAPPVGGATVTVGLSLARMPRFDGAAHDRTRALPLLSYRSGRFFADPLLGVGYDLSNLDGWQLGPMLAYRFGRKAHDDAHLQGLGDIAGGLDLGGFARRSLGPIQLQATLRQGVSGQARGTQLKLGASYTLAAGLNDRLVLDASVDWADRTVMQGLFGVTVAQSARSGLPQHDVGAGVRRFGSGVLWTHALTPQWFSTAGLTLHRLGDNTATSPVAQKRHTSMMVLGLGLRF
jgi:outer membrane protein